MAGAIYEICGRPIDLECKAYLRKRGSRMNVSEVMHTDSHNLNPTCKYIIHACGPKWHDYSSSDKAKCFNDLKDTFFNAFVYAENRLSDATSIAVPLISSGLFGVPRIVCCEALMCAIDDYLSESCDDKRNLIRINLTNLDKETYADLFEYFKTNLPTVKPIDEETDEAESMMHSDIYDAEKVKGLEKPAKASEQCCECKREANNVGTVKCGCKYCVDCLQTLEQSYDNQCQNELCSKKIAETRGDLET